MSTKITSLTAAGLTAMGLTWAATPGVAEPQEPPATIAPGSAPSVPTPPTATPPTAAAPGSEAKPTVLLLSNDHVLHGEVLEDATGYFLKHRIGVKHYSRRQVAGAFGSLEEAYRFKLARLPKNDADEQMKLAVWCLEQKLDAHAREHLDVVLNLSPENHRAKAMLFQLNASNAPPTDPAVSQTGGTMIETDPAEPRELSINTIRNLDREYRASGPPIIFDLPAPIAYRRYQEFGRTVHRELQQHCARCHNADTYGGDFRLVFARARRDLQNDTLIRTNLDATLRLIDPDDLAHSELLSVAALTHPPDGRPVLGGPNHPSYRVLLDWVTSLQDPAARASSEVTPVQYTRPAPAPKPAEGFAVGRAGPVGPSGPEPIPGTGPIVAPPLQPVDEVSGRFTVSDPSVPADVRFPDPTRYRVTPTAAGPRVMPPKAAMPAAPRPAATRPTAPQPPAASAGMAPAPGQPGSLVQLPNGQTGMVLPDGQIAPFVSEEALQEGASPANLAPATAPQIPAQAPASAPPAPAPVPQEAGAAAPKINNDALQQFLMNRAGSQ